MLGTMMDFPLTLVPILERAGKLYGRIEIVSRRPDRSIARTNYGAMYQRARRLARALELAGLARGDRVATLMWNHSAHLEAYFGIPASGGVLHTLNLRLHASELAYIVNHARDRYLIVDDVLLPIYESIRSQVHFERVFVVPFCGQPIPRAYESYEDFSARPTTNLNIRCSRRMKRPRCVLRQVRLANQREWSIRIAHLCFTVLHSVWKTHSQ